MADGGITQSPHDLPFAVPGNEGSGVSSRGGADLGSGGRQETENGVSGLPLQPDTYNPGSGDPGKWSHVDVPDTIPASGTIKTT